MLILTSIINARIAYKIINNLREAPPNRQSGNYGQATNGNLYDRYGNVYNMCGFSSKSSPKNASSEV